MTVSNERFLAHKAALRTETQAQTEPLQRPVPLLVLAGMLANLVGQVLHILGRDSPWAFLFYGLGLGLIAGGLVVVGMVFAVRRAWKRAHPIDTWAEVAA